MHTIFRDFLTQYSRRLLSILAQQLNKRNKSLVMCCQIPLLMIRFVTLQLNNFVMQFELSKSAKKKKCGAHTHVHHLSLFFSQYSRRLLSILAHPRNHK